MHQTTATETVELVGGPLCGWAWPVPAGAWRDVVPYAVQESHKLAPRVTHHVYTRSPLMDGVFCYVGEI